MFQKIDAQTNRNNYLKLVSDYLPGFKKLVEFDLPVIDSLMRAAFAQKGSIPFKQQRTIEFGAGGLLALYSFYQGIKQKQSQMLMQGAVIGVALVMIWIVSDQQQIKKKHSSIRRVQLKQNNPVKTKA